MLSHEVTARICGQVFWLTAQSTSCAFPFAERRTVASEQVSSPITAAGPRRNCTALPYYLPDEGPQKKEYELKLRMSTLNPQELLAGELARRFPPKAPPFFGTNSPYGERIITKLAGEFIRRFSLTADKSAG